MFFFYVKHLSCADHGFYFPRLTSSYLRDARVMSAHLSFSAPVWKLFAPCTCHVRALCTTFTRVQLVCDRVNVCVCVCLAGLGLFGQLFGGKARSHVTLCCSSCSQDQNNSGSLCQKSRRTGPNAAHPALSGFHFLGLLLLVTAVVELILKK